MRRLVLWLGLTVLAGLAGVRAGSAGPSVDHTFILTVRVFGDTIGTGFPCPGCNGIFDSRDIHAPLPPMSIVVRDATTDQPIAREFTRHLPDSGSYVQFRLSPGDGFVVELMDIPPDFQLCPNSPRVRRLGAEDFIEGRALVSYSLWRGCSLLVGPPTPTPTSSPTATATSSPTPTLTSSPTATPTPSPTTTPTPTPGATATATNTSTPTPTGTPTPTVTATICPAGITAMVWNDVNGNGQREAGEPALAHAGVTVWAGDEALQSVITEADGRYSFTGLVPGVYRVEETDPPGHRSTTADAVEIQVGCGETKQVFFGDQLETECLRGLIGVVWNDVDGDGRLEAGEPPLAGATLRLRDSEDREVEPRQVTGEGGIYGFENLAADSYTLIEENPAGYPESTTQDNWIIDLAGCRVVTTNFGDRAAVSR